MPRPSAREHRAECGHTIALQMSTMAGLPWRSVAQPQREEERMLVEARELN